MQDIIPSFNPKSSILFDDQCRLFEEKSCPVKSQRKGQNLLYVSNGPISEDEIAKIKLPA